MASEIDIVKGQAQTMVTQANALVVASPEAYKAAVAWLQEVKGVRSRWVELWAKAKADTYAAWKGVVASEKAGTDICDEAERIAKGKALAWRSEQERKAAEEQRRLQSVADEQARRERERLEKEAAKLKTPELREARLAQAAEVQAPVITIAADVSAEGVSTRKTWKAEVVDMAALIAAALPGSVAASFLVVDQKVADAFARSVKGGVAVPGVKFVEGSSLAVRRE